MSNKGAMFFFDNQCFRSISFKNQIFLTWKQMQCNDNVFNFSRIVLSFDPLYPMFNTQKAALKKHGILKRTLNGQMSNTGAMFPVCLSMLQKYLIQTSSSFTSDPKQITHNSKILISVHCSWPRLTLSFFCSLCFLFSFVFHFPCLASYSMYFWYVLSAAVLWFFLFWFPVSYYDPAAGPPPYPPWPPNSSSYYLWNSGICAGNVQKWLSGGRWYAPKYVSPGVSEWYHESNISINIRNARQYILASSSSSSSS